MTITHTIKLDLDRCGAVTRIEAAQGDANTRQLRMELYADGVAWEVPADAQVLVRFRRPDGGSGAYDTLPDGSAACTVSGNVITAALMPQMFTAAGIVTADLCLVRETAVLSTFPFQIDVHPGAGSRITEGGDYIHVNGFLPMPEPAAEGEIIRVTEVDEYGIVRAAQTMAVDDAPVNVLVNEQLDLLGSGQNTVRCCYHLGNRISLEAYDGYRINRLGVLASPGSEIRFVLFSAVRGEDNTGTLIQLAVLGTVVADSETGLALLDLGGSYEVTRDDTVILAQAADPVIDCHELSGGIFIRDNISFDDGDCTGSEDGTEIPCTYTTGVDSDSAIGWSLFVRDLDYFTGQTLGQYIRETERRFLEIGKADCALPAVTAADDGKILTVENGVWTPAEANDGTSMETILAETVIDMEDAGDGTLYTGTIEVSFSGFVVNETYSVYWDGREYTVTATEDELFGIGLDCASGSFSMFVGEEEGKTYLVILTDNADSHTVAIYKKDAVATESYVRSYVEQYISDALGGDY